MNDKVYCVYILASSRNGTLYVGFTSNLERRIWQHKNGCADGFTKKYGVTKLVYYEVGGDFDGMLRREKRIKEWRRHWKIELIESVNPEWCDLSEIEFTTPLDSGFRRNGMERSRERL